ncbi:MAG: hypothetical protein IJ508_01480 [Oscillospiraceae bacterium]|nr:hypothetical protein [Oscillospiraceae bacterium]
MRKKRIMFSPSQTIALCFVAVIFAGTLLLMMPFTSRNEVGLSFLDSLFTATSATCVTGLVVVDTWSHFNWLGQGILLILIQVGGLGYMTLMITTALLIGKKIGLRQRSTMMESISAQNLSDVAGLARYILFGTLAIEGCGAVLLALRFVPEMGFGRGCWYAVFHSISAFCNAGFDLMGFRSPFSSLTFYVEDPPGQPHRLCPHPAGRAGLYGLAGSLDQQIPLLQIQPAFQADAGGKRCSCFGRHHFVLAFGTKRRAGRSFFRRPGAGGAVPVCHSPNCRLQHR